jgi:hypothetical protein
MDVSSVVQSGRNGEAMLVIQVFSIVAENGNVLRHALVALPGQSDTLSHYKNNELILLRDKEATRHMQRSLPP